MAKRLQLRRGTTAEHSSFIGAAGEPTYDTDKKSLVLHDGITPGGTGIASTEDEVNQDIAIASKAPQVTTYTKVEVNGLLVGKVDDSQVLTNVPANAVFTDTAYVIPLATSSVIGGIKARITGTTLFLRNDGSNA